MCNFFRRALITGGTAPRKRMVASFLLLIAVIFTIIIWDSTSARLGREMKMEKQLAEMQERVVYMETLYLAHHEEAMLLQDRLKSDGIIINKNLNTVTTAPEDLTVLFKNITGTRTASGLRTSNVHIQTSFVYQLLPHLMNDPNSLRPAYHFKSCKNYSNIVLGIPTVKRDKESYLLLTLESLIEGLKGQEVNETLIVVYVGETDLEYVTKVAQDIETKFPVPFENGLIEVISPRASYYPLLSELKPNLGDSRKRFRWRTKQNLDLMFLMSYVRTKAPYYLMLEDDVLASPTYMAQIKAFTQATSVLKPDWFYIEYSPVGGIGKLFRSSELLHFITYVQLFYDKFPIDWLLDKYLSSRTCTLDITSKHCLSNKLLIRPKYKSNLFQHIGLYSSLKGKIQKVKKVPKRSFQPFYPHNNPPLASAKTSIKAHGSHLLLYAYLGTDYFWGITPKNNDTITFIFAEPTVLERFTFRSANPEHVTDKLYPTVIEVLPNGTEEFKIVGEFDEFGLAEGSINKEFGALKGIRLRVTSNLDYWALLSEIELIPAMQNGSTSSVAQNKNSSS